MKKLICIFLLLIGFTLVSCNEKPEEPKNTIKVITPYGTPFIALADLLDNEFVELNAVNGADYLKSALVEGSYDIICAPVNLGTQLYLKGNSKYKMASVITMNNAYIVTKDDNKLSSLDDLKDQKVLGFGQTGIPGSILKDLYSKNENLDTANIDFTSASSSQVYSIFAGTDTEYKYALMSQPEIAKLEVVNEIKVKTLNLTSLYETNVPQACLYVNPECQYLDEVNELLAEIEENIKNINRDFDAYAQKIINADRTISAMGIDVLENSLPEMSIIYKSAKDVDYEIENILTILGVGIPEKDFYY